MDIVTIKNSSIFYLNIHYVFVLFLLIKHCVLQDLATGVNFGVILETIPPLMDSLQIIWMLSCHYNTNERMVPLMERIAWQLCERVTQIIDVHELFKYVQIHRVLYSDPFIQTRCIVVSA